jgi:hypothetical protein
LHRVDLTSILVVRRPLYMRATQLVYTTTIEWTWKCRYTQNPSKVDKSRNQTNDLADLHSRNSRSHMISTRHLHSTNAHLHQSTRLNLERLLSANSEPLELLLGDAGMDLALGYGDEEQC